MVPRKFNIVDFGGFDLADQYGEALPGIYDKIVDAHWNCVYIMCFGLKFAGFDIAPQYMIPEMFSDHIMLNGIISIDQNDVITIPSIMPAPDPPAIQALTATENRVYEVPEGVDGFNPVTVEVITNLSDTYSAEIEEGEVIVDNCSSIVASENYGLGRKAIVPIASNFFDKAEIETEVVFGSTRGVQISLGGTNSNSGQYSVSSTNFSLYANGNRFSVAHGKTIETGSTHLFKIVLHIDGTAELYIDNELCCSAISNYVVNGVTYVCNVANSIAIGYNKSASSENSNSYYRSFRVKLFYKEISGFIST